MICDHSTLTNTTSQDQYVLVYCGTTVLFAEYTGYVTSTCHNVETFETAQDLVDRGLDLGLQCGDDFMLKAMEHGATFPTDIMEYLHSLVWTSSSRNVERMKALGYSVPKEYVIDPISNLRS